MLANMTPAHPQAVGASGAEGKPQVFQPGSVCGTHPKHTIRPKCVHAWDECGIRPATEKQGLESLVVRSKMPSEAADLLGLRREFDFRPVTLRCKAVATLL